MDNRRVLIKSLLVLFLVTATILSISGQNTEENCLTIPYSSNQLIQVNKSTGEETVLGSIGTNQVQAIALVPTADTIYAAKPGKLGIITFSSIQFMPLPMSFGTGNGSHGPIDFIEVEGLSFDIASRTLFGSVKVAEPALDVIIQINTETGAFIPDAFGPGEDYVTIEGPGVFSIVEDIAINPVDGKMYGLAREEVGNDILISINKHDGSAQVVGVAGINLLEGLGFDNDGKLYATPGFNTTLPSRFFQMNLLTGMAETIGELTAKDYESCDCLWPALLNSAPVVNDDHYQTNINEELEVDAPGVLENDSDADGNSLIIVSHDTTTVIGGHVELNPDGSFNYIPPDGFVGEDSFTYTVTDGQEEGSGTVTVAVVDPENNDPVAMDDHYDIEIDTDLEVAAPGVLSNDSDPDGDTLTIIAHDTTTTIGGIVTLNPDGSFKYTPPSDTTGVDTFTYIIGDPGGKRDTAEVSITIKEPGTPHNSPPNAEDDDLETDLDSELIITDPSEGVLENDSDPDGDEITVQEVIDGITEQGGRINIHSDGTLSYIPRLGFIGTDSVEYTICDDQEPQLCDSAMIYIVVNELPIEVYSAFSPNGDGVNDSWIIQGITRFPDNVVRIFNRWGNLIFEVAGYDNTTKVWNGNASKGVVFGGSEAPDGAYYYIIDLGDGSERLSGYVVIRR